MADSTGLTRAVDPVTGIVLQVDEIPSLQRLPRIHAALATPCDPRPLGGLAPIQQGGGAAFDRDEAIASAICEVLERYCGVFSPPAHVGTWEQQQGFRPSIEDLNGMYDATAAGFTPIHASARGRWCSGIRASDGSPAVAPWSLVCLGATPSTRLPEDEFYLGPCVSTGLAAGRNPDDAAVRGILECVERDGVMLAWYSRQFAGRISQDDLRASFGELMLELDRCGLCALVLDTTVADIGLPVHMCVIYPRRDPGRVAFGMACAPTAYESVKKALIESIQTWAWASSASSLGDAVIRSQAGRFMDDFSDRVVAYGSGQMRSAVRDFLDQTGRVPEVGLPPPGPTLMRPSIDVVAERLSRAGHDALLFDVTTDDVKECGVAVVRALCPSLQAMEAAHAWARPNAKRARTLGLTLIAADVPHPFP